MGKVSPLTAGPDHVAYCIEKVAQRIFALRSILVHQWRKFLFSDPGLPAALLPPAWPGHDAARLFRAESARLWPAASRFVDGCLWADQPEAAPPATGRGLT